MFICVSPNPAVDKRLTVPSLVAGTVIRASSARGFAGGKSTHVAMVLRTLGEAPKWIGPCGGSTGEELVEGLLSLGIEAHPCETRANTRTNLEIIEADGTVTEILEPGSELTAAEIVGFENNCQRLFANGPEGASVIFSGSLPTGVPTDLYARLIVAAQETGCRTFVDASGEPLRSAISARPDFVKPNRDESGALLGMTIDSVASAGGALRALLKLGAHSAALSLGADGLLFCPDESAPVYFAPAVALAARSTVGCGDAALAGFARATALKLPPEETLRMAAACAAANCLADSPGAGRLADIQKFETGIRVQVLTLGS
jgi:1-phosphofructokinase family hexose kinase